MKTTTFVAPTEKPKRKPSPALALRLAFPVFLQWSEGRRPRFHDEDATIWLPLPPNLANSRMIWQVKEAARQEYFGECAELMARRLLPSVPEITPEYATVTVTLHVKRLMDRDNSISRYKWCMDYMVRAGYIMDDSERHLQYSGMPTQVVVKGSPPRVEIRLTASHYQPPAAHRAAPPEPEPPAE